MKKVTRVYEAPSGHWVGDGFPVRSILSYNEMGEAISPFLLLDYGGPLAFPPTTAKAGVGAHPHKGFETVTIVYQGELEHRDSGDNHGTIGPGDVQWMTAASGVVHEEFHSREFARNGGTLEMVQLWVNLPARFKAASPRYQTLLNSDIPVVVLPDESGTVRIIAGVFQGTAGPAQTFTPINLWDVRLKAGHQAVFNVPTGHTTAVFVMSGKVVINGAGVAGEAQLVLLDRDGDSFQIEAQKDAVFLVLNGEPINEPVAWQGPFVMNTKEELRQAMMDYQGGQMGRIARTS